MDCWFCGKEIKIVMNNVDVHWKSREYVCPDCGLVKNEVLSDGRIIRVWEK